MPPTLFFHPSNGAEKRKELQKFTSRKLVSGQGVDGKRKYESVSFLVIRPVLANRMQGLITRNEQGDITLLSGPPEWGPDSMYLES